jgi:hypothetical protein
VPHAGAAQFFYGAAYQYGQSNGAFASYTVTQPALAAADSHSLAELAVESADGQQIVEIGYTVDRGLNGNALPHLFVYHWVNRTESCYNGCGFVQYDASLRPGAALTVGSVHQFAIEQFNGNWWVGDGTTWIGYFPGSLWNGTYTQAGLIQWFGEVSAFTATPCSDMGNGLFASTGNASASITGISYFAGPPVSLSIIQPTPSLYTAVAYSTNNVRYGGPGAC